MASAWGVSESQPLIILLHILSISKYLEGLGMWAHSSFGAPWECFCIFIKRKPELRGVSLDLHATVCSCLCVLQQKYVQYQFKPSVCTCSEGSVLRCMLSEITYCAIAK